jgi:purine-cytosine permease-like protein
MSEILHQLDVMTQARRSRLVAAEGTVPGVVWSVLFGGAVVTVVFTFFFGTRNLRAQVMMTVLLSILVFSELLIIVAIDRPFSGTVKVEPDALERVLADFKSELGSSPNSPEQPR